MELEGISDSCGEREFGYSDGTVVEHCNCLFRALKNGFNGGIGITNWQEF